MTDIGLIKLALDALEYIDDGANNQGAHTGISWRCVSTKAEPAITALKERLAQEKALQALHNENERLGLYKDAYAQPEQEPVAWINAEKRTFEWNGPVLWNTPTVAVLNKIPLYTTPPQRPWIGLTIEEIAACCMESTTTQLSFYNAIEAKLRIKNQ